MKTKSNLNSGHTKTVSTPYQRRIKSVPKDRSRGESDHPSTVREYGLYLKRGIATSDIAAEIVGCLIPHLKPTGKAYCFATTPKTENIMGAIKQGILGGFTGKVGTVIGSTWKNVCYMRAKAINVANPRTPKQQHQRAKLTLGVNFLKRMMPYIRVGFRLQATDCTAYNAAMSYMLSHAITGTDTAVTIDYNRVLVACGTLQPVYNAKVAVSGTAISFTWEDNSYMGDAAATDIAMPLLYNKARQEVVYLLDGATRADGKVEMTIPEVWKGEALAIYLAFRSADNDSQTNSICLQNDAYDETPGNIPDHTDPDTPASGDDGTGGGGTDENYPME